MNYQLLIEQMEGLAETDAHYLPLLSNVSALIYETVSDINWAGFYFVREQELVLGPFQGKLACIHIPFGRGVCGTAAQTDSTQRIENVHEFPGHIPCDCASNSELVIPIHKNGSLIGVLDLDSPSLKRFTEDDAKGLEAFVKRLEELIILPENIFS